MATVLANPAEMIERGAPHVIHTDEELEVYTKALFSLTSIDHPNAAQAEAIELLALSSHAMRANAIQSPLLIQ
jgi:HTH-type transcriptional regulator/antitoxin HigA